MTLKFCLIAIQWLFHGVFPTPLAAPSNG